MPKVNFRPDTEGFAFVNSWQLEGTEITEMSKIVTDAVDIVIEPILLAVISPLLVVELAVPIFGPLLVYETIVKTRDFIRDKIVGALDAQNYGFCGGMAFAALDYWKQSLIISAGNDSGDQPHQSTPTGKALRAYILGRLIKSLEDNAGKFLEWLAIYHAPLGPQGSWLRDQTKAQLVILKSNIDSGIPVTIGLVADSWNPFDSHQVLAYGYDDHPDGSCTIYIYDNNFPGVEETIRFDFSKGDLATINADGTEDSDWINIKGMFCTNYSPSIPPAAIVQTENLVCTPLATEVNRPISLSYTVENIGFHDTPPFFLGLVDDRSDNSHEANDAVLAEDDSRTFATSMSFNATCITTVRVYGYLKSQDGTISLPKKIPAQNGVIQTVQVTVFAKRKISVYNPAKNCLVENTIGNTTEFEVAYADLQADLGNNLSFQWSVTGATIVGNANTPRVAVKMPLQVGAPVIINVIVSNQQGIYSSGSLSFVTVSMQTTMLQLAICKLSRIITTTPFSNILINPAGPDPGPEEINSVEQTVLVQLNAKELEAVRGSLQGLSLAIDETLKSAAPVYYPINALKKE